jgi:hypothetical protein
LAVWGTNKPDYKKWNALKLNVQLENGYFLFPQGGYTFSDSPEFPDEPVQIDIMGVDTHVLEDFFLQKPPKPFVVGCWETITIEQKIGLENVLLTELGLNNKSFFDFLKPKNKFLGFEFSTLCRSKYDDDVLYAVNKSDFDYKFAIIHLTLKGKKEIEDFRHKVFFKDFEEFWYSEMDNLTNLIQEELDKINSKVVLLTNKDAKFRIDSKHNASALSGENSIWVSSFLENEKKHLQLERNRLIAGDIATENLNIIAQIIDEWLSKSKDIFVIQNTFKDFKANKFYIDILTLSVETLLQGRWKELLNDIISGGFRFDKDLFCALNEQLGHLYPNFSHDVLYFDNIIGYNHNSNFKSPIIYCNDGLFEISDELNPAISTVNIKTKDINYAVNKVIELLPKNYSDTKKPFYA